MTDREKWKQLIRRGNFNRMNRMMRGLFDDMSRTLPFIRAVIDVAITNPDLPELVECIREIRKIARELPLERLGAVLDAVVNDPDNGTYCILMLGAYRDEKEEAMLTFRRLTDLADRQLNVLKKDGKGSSASFAMVALMEAGVRGHTSAWGNFLRRSYELNSSSTLREILLAMTIGNVTYRVVPFSHWVGGTDKVFVPGDGTNSIFIPVPDALTPWVESAVDRLCARIGARDVELVRLAEDMRAHPDAWRSTYEDMWLEMMLEPKWGLRDEGLDCVTVSIPELVASGHKTMRFFPLEPFPAFRVMFRMARTSRTDRFIQIDLEPSDLLQVQNTPLPDDDSLLYWVDRVLAFTAVRAVWMIVMGHLSSKPTREGKPRSPGDAVVRPQFRHLPAGYRASPEARARALDTFRKEPLPGFTFVRQYERGASPQSGQPLFALSDLGARSSGA